MLGFIGLVLYLTAAALTWGALYLTLLRNSNLIANIIVYIIIFGCINIFIQSPAILITFVIAVATIFFIVLQRYHAHKKQMEEEIEKKERIEAIQQRKKNQKLEKQKVEAYEQRKANAEEKLREQAKEQEEKERYKRYIYSMYHTLGCDPNDSFNDVRVQYRKLMQQYNYNYNNPEVDKIDKCFHKIENLHEESFIKNNDLGDF